MIFLVRRVRAVGFVTGCDHDGKNPEGQKMYCGPAYQQQPIIQLSQHIPAILRTRSFVPSRFHSCGSPDIQTADHGNFALRPPTRLATLMMSRVCCRVTGTGGQQTDTQVINHQTDRKLPG